MDGEEFAMVLGAARMRELQVNDRTLDSQPEYAVDMDQRQRQGCAQMSWRLKPEEKSWQVQPRPTWRDLGLSELAMFAGETGIMKCHSALQAADRIQSLKYNSI